MLASVCTYNSVMLYWDLPEKFKEGNIFSVRFSDEILTTHKCHINIENLNEDTEYTFYVYMGSEEIGILTCKTQRKKRMIDITKPPYCAVGDGKTLNTEKIQRAIDDCGNDECVYVPAGTYMTGSLRLHSDMELYLEKDAIIQGTTNFCDYEPKIKSRFEGHEMMCYSALINIGHLDRNGGYNCKNVRICGEGTICGGGMALATNVIEREKVLLKEYMETHKEELAECECADTVPGRARPRLINMSNAQNVEIFGITIMNGASWNVHMIYSDNIVTHSCAFRSHGVFNGDGWDPDSSTNCTLFNCDFYTWDDSVAIKSGKNPEGNIINKPTKHIRVFDCVSYEGHGIAIGSEMSGGVEDVRIWNCNLKNSVFGVEIKATKKRGGYVKNVSVRNSSLCRVLIHSVGYNDDGEAAPSVPVFSDCEFSDLHITGISKKREGGEAECDAIELAGFNIPGHYIKNVKFKNIKIDSDKPRKHSLSLQCCEGVSFENIYVK